VEELEQNALNFLKNREYDKAAKIYLQLAMAHPEEEKFLIAAASCYDNMGDKKTAFSLYKKALGVNAQSLTALLNSATILYELKRYDKVIPLAERALALQSDNFSALMNLGNAYYAMERFDTALELYEKMYKLNPQSYNAIFNIANTCYNLGQYIRAIEFATMAIDKRPTSAEPYIIAGNSYIELARNEDATNCLKKAAEIAPTSDWLCNSIANLFQKMGNWKQCLHYAWKAIALKGQHVTLDDQINFAYFLYEVSEETQNRDLVEKYLTRWEEMFPDNTIIHHTCSALRNVQDVTTMDLTYVKGLFDGFASSFDDILGELDYRVPQLIAENLKNYLKTKLFKKRRILDLGCGTGLCTEALKQYFPNEEFYGVDISDKMLEQAEKKGIYQELYADDIINFLKANQQLFHAVVAGDVLTYIGELKPLFHVLTTAVKFNGFLAFSISKNTVNNNDYFLMPSGRFVHTLNYVFRILKYCGFKVLSAEEATLRHEGAREVKGYVIVAQKEIEVVFE